MEKSIATLIDELTVTNIKIYHLVDKIQNNEHTAKDAKKLKDLNSFRLELSNALNGATTMKKSLATLIDELTVTNIKIFYLVEKIENNKHTLKDAKLAHDLNRYRSKLCNALNKEYKERENIKV